MPPPVGIGYEAWLLRTGLGHPVIRSEATRLVSSLRSARSRLLMSETILRGPREATTGFSTRLRTRPVEKLRCHVT